MKFIYTVIFVGIVFTCILIAIFTSVKISDKNGEEGKYVNMNDKEGYYQNNKYNRYTHGGNIGGGNQLRDNDFKVGETIANEELENSPEPKLEQVLYMAPKSYCNWKDYKIEKEGILKDKIPIHRNSMYATTDKCYGNVEGNIPGNEMISLVPDKDVYTNTAQEIIVRRY